MSSPDTSRPTPAATLARRTHPCLSAERRTSVRADGRSPWRDTRASMGAASESIPPQRSGGDSTSRAELIGSAIMIVVFLSAAVTDWPLVAIAALLQAVQP